MININERIGSYRLIKIIGRGSFGVVYLAEHINTKLEVAIKLLKPDLLSPERPDYQEKRKSFLDEVRMLKELKHPHILSIIEDGFYKDTPYLITEYASKGTLQDRLEQRPSQPLPIDEALTIITQVGLALYHAHDQHKIVHRDLKPANILFNAKGDALLADFGIAIVLKAGVTENADFAGTPRYMAPEQFHRLASVKSDQFALGSIAYELVTGRSPFQNLQGWLFNEKPVNPRIYNLALPEHMAKTILKAIEKERRERHSSVFAFINELSPSKIKEQRLREGDNYYEVGDYEKALAAYEKAIYCDRDYISAHLGRGRALSALGRDKPALGAYKRVLLLDPENVSALYGKGMSLRNLQRYEEALAAFEQLILFEPGDADYYKEKGVILYHLGRYEEALAAYEQVIYKQETVRKFGPKDIETYNLRGSALLKLERYEQALAIYEQVLYFDSYNATALYSKGIALYHLQRYDEALTTYQQAARSGSSRTRAYTYASIGIALNELGRKEEALVAFEQSLQLDPMNVEIHVAVGTTLSTLMRYEEALEAYEQALLRDPKRVSAYTGKGFVLKMLAQYNEALAAYERATLLDPSHSEIDAITYISKGFILKKLTRYEEALEAYEQALLLDPDNADIHYHKGCILEEMQRYAEALLAYQQCIKLAPNNPFMYTALGRVQENLMLYQDALDTYGSAIQLDASYGDAYIGKGRVLNVLKRYPGNKIERNAISS